MHRIFAMKKSTFKRKEGMKMRIKPEFIKIISLNEKKICIYALLPWFLWLQILQHEFNNERISR